MVEKNSIPMSGTPLDQPSFPPRDMIFAPHDRFLPPLRLQLEFLGSLEAPLTTTPYNHLWLKEG